MKDKKNTRKGERKSQNNKWERMEKGEKRSKTGRGKGIVRAGD